MISIANILLFHAKKMRTSGVAAALMTCLVFTLLLSLAAAAAAETVKVTTTPVFPHIPRHQASKDFQVLVRVEAPPAVQQRRRVPVDLAVVLDVGGGATRLAAVRKAVKFVVSQIHDDDRLAIVGPSNYRRVTGFLNTRDARRDAEKFVDDLEPRRDGEFTASGVGLEEAIKILGDLPATTSRARFVILVTDTAVAESSSSFSKLPLPVHTIGLGAAPDPRVLLSIARQSQGTYSFVDDDEDTDAITGAIAIRLGELKDVVAVNTRVLVEAPVGITIERIESGGYRTNTRDYQKTSGEIAVGALYAGEVKSFLVHLSVPALPSTSTVDGGCDKQQLLTTSFFGDYYTTSDEEDSAPSPATAVTQAILYVQRPTLDVAGVGALQRVPVPVVMNHIARFGVLEMVTTFVDNNIWKLSSSVTAEVATKLRIQWEQFVQARQFWSGLDLEVLDVEVNRMVSILETATTRSGSSTRSSLSSATAYMLSWLSSYQMQRPTAMGSPGTVAAAFVTVNMQLTLQQATTITTAPLCGGCPACENRCVHPLPPPVLEPSGRDDDTYRVNAAYLSVPGGVLVDTINEAMKQMYLALIQANKLRTCDAGVEVLQPPPPRAVAFA